MIESDTLSEVEQIAQKLTTAKHIFVLTGAGISTACGIPDFRTPESGLYSNLKKYNLAIPTMIFTIQYFKRRPGPFFDLLSSMVASMPPGGYTPSTTHYFLSFLEAQEKILMHVTQNVDDMEFSAGAKQVTQAHGSFFRGAVCADCRKEYPIGVVIAALLDGAIPCCEKCGGFIKPTVVFFGEETWLDSDKVQEEVEQSDLMLVMGTSLNVGPVNDIPLIKNNACTRVLVNTTDISGPYKFDYKCLQSADSFCEQVIQKMGLQEQFSDFVKHQHNSTCENIIQQSRLSESPDHLTLCAVSGSFIIPTSVQTECTDGTHVMLFKATDEQLDVLKTHSQSSLQKNIVIENVPEQFRPEMPGNVLQITVYRPTSQDDKEQQYYKPIKGHYSSYVSQFVEKAEDPSQSLNTWDAITNRIGSWKITQLLRLAPQMLQNQDSVISRIRVDAGAKIKSRHCLKTVKSVVK